MVAQTVQREFALQAYSSNGKVQGPGHCGRGFEPWFVQAPRKHDPAAVPSHGRPIPQQEFSPAQLLAMLGATYLRELHSAQPPERPLAWHRCVLKYCSAPGRQIARAPSLAALDRRRAVPAKLAVCGGRPAKAVRRNAAKGKCNKRRLSVSLR